MCVYCCCAVALYAKIDDISSLKSNCNVVGRVCGAPYSR